MIASKDRCCVGQHQFRLELLSSGHIALAGLNIHGGSPGPRPDARDQNGYSSSLTTSKILPLNRQTHVA